MSLILETVQTEGIAASLYLIGDDETGVAAVIDPRADVEIYVEMAKARKLTITHVFETHIHADLLSGSRELAARVGTAKIFVSAEGHAAYDFEHEALRDGASFQFGDSSSPPGTHPATPRSICRMSPPNGHARRRPGASSPAIPSSSTPPAGPT